MIRVSKRVDKVLKNWCEANLKPVVGLDWFNPRNLSELRQSRLKGFVKVYAHGSNNTIFNFECTKLYYRAWHDTLHLKYNLEFNDTNELILAEIQYKELLKLGITPWDAYLIKLDLELHIKHYSKYKVHPEYQGEMIANYIMYGEKALDRNYGFM